MRPRDCLVLAFSLMLLTWPGRAAAQDGPGRGRIWIGPPVDPERYYRFATDNGIPGTGRYAYTDYNWPSLREALDEYGLFGRRYRQQSPMVSQVPQPTNAAASLRVLLPADAEVWIAGQMTSSRGSERLFMTPPLEPGCAYTGEIRARWFENGRAIERRHALRVYSGDRRTIDLRTAANETDLLHPPRYLENTQNTK